MRKRTSRKPQGKKVLAAKALGNAEEATPKAKGMTAGGSEKG